MHFESFGQNLEIFYEDDLFMDDEIIEAFQENPFHYQEEKVEDGFHYTCENFQRELASPLGGNETYQVLSI